MATTLALKLFLKDENEMKLLPCIKVEALSNSLPKPTKIWLGELAVLNDEKILEALSKEHFEAMLLEI